VSTCSFERKMVFSQVIAAIHHKEPLASLERLDAASGSMEAVIDKLNSRCLFGGPSIVILDGIEKCKKAGIDVLTAYVENPSPFSFLLLGSSSSKQIAPLYQKGKKDLIALDLSEEKPWERKPRLQRYLVMSAQKEGKQLSAEAALYLLEHVSTDLATLEQEMFKLVCFCAERTHIGRADVQTLCALEVERNSWQLAEAIIWETSGMVSLDHSIELSWLLPFIGQLRYQLQIGLQMASSLRTQASPEEIGRQFPQIRGPVLSQRIAFVREHGPRYFHAAMHQLFELELMMKNSTCDPALALDLLISKLTYFKKAHDHETTRSSASPQFIG